MVVMPLSDIKLLKLILLNLVCLDFFHFLYAKDFIQLEASTAVRHPAHNQLKKVYQLR